MQTMSESAHAALIEKTPAERSIGPETRAVRIFREVFAEDAQAAKHLGPTLDRFLKRVLTDPGAKRGDKTYARKIYADLSRQIGGEAQALPEWAKKEEGLTDQDLRDILSAADNAPATAAAQQPTMDVDFSDLQAPAEVDPLDSLFGRPVAPSDVEVQCQNYLKELLSTNDMPFVVSFSLPSGRYVALGTVLGTVLYGKHTGKKVNIHCTLAGYKRLRDAESDHFVHVDGKPLTLSADDPKTGLRKHLFCLRHKPGLKIRYWTRINDRDENDRARFFVLTTEGIRPITREQF